MELVQVWMPGAGGLASAAVAANPAASTHEAIANLANTSKARSGPGCERFKLARAGLRVRLFIVVPSGSNQLVLLRALRTQLDTTTGTQPSGCGGVSIAPCCSVNAAFLFAEPCMFVVVSRCARALLRRNG